MDNNDYELKVLRAYLQEQTVQATIASTVPPDYFLNSRHRDVFDEALRYAEKYSAVPTAEILKDLLGRLRPPEKPLYDVLVDRLFVVDEGDDLQHLPYYTRRLGDEWRSAQAQAKIGQAIGQLRDKNVDAALQTLHEETPMPYSERVEGDITVDLYKAVDEAKERAKNPALYLGVPMGYQSIDIATGGHGRGELVVVVGGTGVGKSLILGQTAINVAKRRRKVLLVTVENNKQAYMHRLYSNITKVPYFKFKTNQLDRNDMDTWLSAMSDLPEDFYLKVVEFPEGCSARDIWSYMRTLAEEIDYLVVDQISNMMPNELKSFQPMSWQFYSQIALDLKRLAGYAYRNRGIPVLSAAQAAGGTVGKKELTVDDIAGTKQIIHHAHGALYVTREDEEYTMGSSKWRDALVKPFPVFPEFKYWSVSENSDIFGFSPPPGGPAPQDRPQVVPTMDASFEIVEPPRLAAPDAPTNESDLI